LADQSLNLAKKSDNILHLQLAATICFEVNRIWLR